MYYTGIGSKGIPYEALISMTRVAEDLAKMGYTLRTGRSDCPAERAFRMGVENHCKRFPSKNELKTDYYSYDDIIPYAINIAKMYIGDWGTLSPRLKNYYAISVMLVFGQDLINPSKFLICWTGNGAESAAHVNRRTGPAGLCIKIARNCEIPVINLKRENAMDKLTKVLRKLEENK